MGGGGKWSSNVKLPNAEALEPALVSLCCSEQLEAQQQRSEWDLASLCACPVSHLRRTPPPPNGGASLDAALAPCFISKCCLPTPRYLKEVLIRDGQHTTKLFFLFFYLALEIRNNEIFLYNCPRNAKNFLEYRLSLALGIT